MWFVYLLNYWFTTMYCIVVIQVLNVSSYPFNCQFVVKRQQIKNHSNLGILGVMAHTLFIKCIQLTALGHVKSAGRGAYAHAAKDFFCTE